jgi:hypothetical protein
MILLKPDPWPGAALAVATMVVTWFLYVPIHELLHVAGCLVTGGTVQVLEVSPMYGGHVLARIFSFVHAGGEYAGRLSGFEHGGSDTVYGVTVFMPFVLTIVLGVPLMIRATRRSRPVSFGAGLIIGLAPFMQLPGDYHEMGSIVVTRAIAVAQDEPLLDAFRSDDVVKLCTEVLDRPDESTIPVAMSTAAALAIVAASIGLGITLAMLTYWLGLAANRLWPSSSVVDDDGGAAQPG